VIQLKERQIKSIQSILLLSGAFTFAFLLGELVHEYGHYFTHLAYGNQGISVHLDPFGGSRIVDVSPLQDKAMGVTSAAGPLANLALGVTFMFLLWRVRRPLLLPLLLWGPIAMVQEGVNFSLGLLSPGSDAQWVAASGVPQPVILLAGILLLSSGVVMIAAIAPLDGIEGENPERRKLFIVLTGMCSLMLLRCVYSFIVFPEAAMENLIPLVFSLLLAAIIVLLQEPASRIAGRDAQPRPPPVAWLASFMSLFLGIGMFTFQLLVLN
jgi:heme/copper-type cytochrome/quinol oxidase subunit 3